MDRFLKFVIQLSNMIGIVLALLLLGTACLLIWAPNLLRTVLRYGLGIAGGAAACYLIFSMIRSFTRLKS